MDRIRKDVTSLELRVKLIDKLNSKEEHEYSYINEMLTQKLLELDEINVRGNENARRRRKRLIDKVLQLINVLDSKISPRVQEPLVPNEERCQPESESAEGVETQPGAKNELPKKSLNFATLAAAASSTKNDKSDVTGEKYIHYTTHAYVESNVAIDLLLSL
ncbi:hypothetical protein QAD02_003485 [Eretmocerus hayati]|uniref:Uncharacterized protein n=1 Tax=Eretmocerus hayati TaxID=131215 RepID=A0ACC2NMT8_9HYME|nr:hypothetical protein QAD02_003485 [Eretmocerus hayati]